MFQNGLPDLSAYFLALVEACHIEPKVSGNPWHALEAAYKRPPRAYHNINHAVECAMMGEACQLPAIGVMALFYHDAFYVPGSTINEVESIDLLHEHFGDWSDKFTSDVPLPHPTGPSPLDSISDLILATKHDRDPKTPLEAVVMDIDMSILGSEPEKFMLYDRAIQEEYSFVSNEDFEVGRVEFLSGLLGKKQIFYSTLLRHRFEKKARENIEWRINRSKREAKERTERNGS